jgi:Ca-activated chloride channel homolog
VRRLHRGGVGALILMALVALSAVPVQAGVQARIDSPLPDQTIFGPTQVKVSIVAGDPVAKIEVFVNGKLVGTMTQPPYEMTFDAGEENIRREFKVVVHSVKGEAVSGSIFTQPVQIDDEMELRLQQLFVTVSRGSERALDLDEGDFRILDNGKAQRIVTFGKGELPLTAVLLVDTSESMKGERLVAARRGVDAFLSDMKPLDEAMLVLFSDRLLRATSFEQEKKDQLGRVVTETEAAGGTAVNDFLYMSLKMLEPRLGRRVVILLSDGSDVHSVLPMSDVLWKARTSQAMIYWIQLEGGAKHKSYASAWRDAKGNDEQYAGLEKAVLESGGRILRIDAPAGIEGAFRNVLRELREQYVIGYYPTDVRKDGRWHQVKVDVERSGVQVRTRDGYVDF